MRSRVAVLAVVALAAAPLLLVGCDGLSGLFGGSGSVRLLVTDKPYPYDFIASAVVTVTRVSLRVADAEEGDDNENDNEAADASGDDDSLELAAQDGGDENGSDNESENENENDNESHDGGFVTVFEGERELNLLDLRNGRVDLLADADVPAGHYDQMRLVVTRGVLTLTDGRVFDLRVPSGSSSGIKLNFEFEVADGEEKVLLLDVDLSRAFSAIPSGHIDDVSTIREFRFQPALAMRLIDVLAAGSVSGQVQDSDGNSLASVAVTVYRGEEEVTSTASEADGSFMLIGLPTGDYRVEFSLAGYADLGLEPVNVQAGAETALGVVVLQSAAAP